VKKYGQFVGLVRIGRILSQFQTVAGEDFLERREGLDISEWRITPLFISLLTEIVETLTTASEKKDNSAEDSEREELEEKGEASEENEDLV
jgi:hypothetical protein